MPRQGHQGAADGAVVAFGDDAHGIARIARPRRAIGQQRLPRRPVALPRVWRIDEAELRQEAGEPRPRPGRRARRPRSCAGRPRSGCTLIRPSPAWRSQKASVGVGDDQVERPPGARGRARAALGRVAAPRHGPAPPAPARRGCACRAPAPAYPRRLSTAATRPSSLSPSQVPPASDVQPGHAPAAGPASGGRRQAGRLRSSSRLAASSSGQGGRATQDERACTSGFRRAARARRGGGLAPVRAAPI